MVRRIGQKKSKNLKGILKYSKAYLLNKNSINKATRKINYLALLIELSALIPLFLSHKK